MIHMDVKSGFDVYEVQTSEGPEFIATKHVSDPVPPLGVTRQLGLVLGVKCEADAVRIARQVEEISNRLGPRADQIVLNTLI